MGDEARDWLVVVDASESAAAVARLRQVADVRYVVAPRLVVVAASDAARLGAVRGVRHVLDPASASQPGLLDPAEVVALRAVQRRQTDRGPRPGDGLAWDAPGHEPPDDPPHV